MTADLSREGLERLLALEDFSPVAAAADRVRREAVGDTVHLRALLELSNHCRRRCAYCGLRADRRDLPRYRMAPEEILSAAREARAAGYRTLVLQSGEDPWYTAARLGEVVAAVKGETGMAVTLSCGEMGEADYTHLRSCGADRYLLKHETADDDLYRALHPRLQHPGAGGLPARPGEAGLRGGAAALWWAFPGRRCPCWPGTCCCSRTSPARWRASAPSCPTPPRPWPPRRRAAGTLTRRCVALARLLLPQANLPRHHGPGRPHPGGAERRVLLRGQRGDAEDHPQRLQAAL